MDMHSELREVAGRMATVALCLTLASLFGCHDAQSSTANVAAESANTALTVTLVSPVTRPWSDRLTATGNIEAWQLMSVGAEVSGVRVVEVLADVGDSVRKGQLLARLDDATARVDLSIQQAALEQARADLAQARVSLGRARKLGAVISQQDLLQAETAEKTSAARFAMAEAQIRALELKIHNTRIVAPEDGVVAARSTSVGALIDGSSELFKLIRAGRIEWRAQLRVEQLAHVEISQVVELRDPLGNLVAGRVRQIAPTADEVSRTSLVYVDLPPDRLLKPGVLATGDFQLFQRMALTVPWSSLTLRDGFNYAMTLDPDGLVKPIKVQIGEQRGNDVEILTGLTSTDQIIASGVGFLHAGDRVKVVRAESARPAMASAAPTRPP
jgi:RND family efflux transporter MFP subunit